MSSLSAPSVPQKSAPSDSCSCRTMSGSAMLHSSSMRWIFLDISSFFISSCCIRSRSWRESSSFCLEMSLRSRFSRESSCSLMSLNRAVTLSVSPAAFSSTSLLHSCSLWAPLSYFSLSGLSFSRTFLSFSFFLSEASFSSSTLWPLCSPARQQDTQIQTPSSQQ
ncbi:hypothetical protein XELAEV_18008136mg [Xenopus laevis]|uniref:Uncharacterized protein n=1 Tax=Xenopus laevis TaxID=8355 RepID=A0A974E436_XENLA|nr:hypothetical protein XELAEV_18008136mg [Xenopus laevis]